MRQSGALAVLFAFSVAAPVAAGGPVSAESFYALKTTTLQGQPADLSQYKGKVTLVVNVASQCGFTPQYKGLQQLQTELSPRGFAILGFPSNDFGGQEPGTATEIKAFCEKNYGVTFPMFSKVVTKAGPDQSAVYTFLGQTGYLPHLELQQVRRWKGRQGRRVLPEQGPARRARSCARRSTRRSRSNAPGPRARAARL